VVFAVFAFANPAVASACAVLAALNPACAKMFAEFAFPYARLAVANATGATLSIAISKVCQD
jgi:hypothetical protein